MKYWKILKTDYSPPIQTGAPICDGKKWPVVLPSVRLDTSHAECGAGWNCTREPDTALRIAGMWGKLLVVEPTEDVVERGDKCRSSGMTLLREATEDEWYEAIEALSWPLMDVPEMVTEQIQWRNAIHSRIVNQKTVERGLRDALKSRGLDWSVKRSPDALAARDAWAASAVRGAWAARAAWAASAASAARDALTVHYAATMGWTKHDPMLLTTGLRDAYANGLAIAIPTGSNELSYALR